MAQQFDWQVVIDIAMDGGPRVQRDFTNLVKAQRELTNQARGTTSEVKKQETALKAQARAATQAKESTNSLRYANYDLASTLLTVSAGLTAVGVAAATAFASQESAFTTVERIVQGNSASISELRGELQKLSTEIPVSFQELSKIASLGAALDIPADKLTKFTEVVAKFAATTGVTAEAAAEGFGRLAAYFDLDETQFEALGSAILRAGNVSIATEEDVLKFSQALALAGDRAGFTAEQTVALGAGIASFGRINVEGAGSALSRITAQIDMATATGGEKLDNFARVAGLSAEQFRLAWDTDSFGTFQRFLGNLGQIDNANLALKELGITNERDSRVILALAQNYDKFNAILGDTTSAWREGTYMNEAYGLVLDDLASKFQIFLNAVTNAAAALGSTFAPMIGKALEDLTGFLVTMADFANSDFGQGFIRIASTMLALVAAWAAVRGGIALATASTLAFKTATSALNAQGLAGQIRYLATQLGIYTPAANGAAGGTWNLGTALRMVARSTVILGFVSLLISAFQDLGGTVEWVGNLIAGFGGMVYDLNLGGNRANGFNTVAKQIRDFGNGIVEYSKTLPRAKDETAEFEKALSQGGVATGEWDDELAGLGDTATTTARKVRTLTDYANDLASVWTRAFEIRYNGQSTLDAINSSFQEMRDAAKEAAANIRQLQADLGLLNADLNTQEYFLSIAVKYGDEKRAAEIRADIAKTNADIADKTADLNAEQAKNNKTLTGNTQAARDNRAEILGLVSQYQAHLQALAASGLSTEELATATAQLEADFIAQAAQLGYNRGELGLYTQSFRDVKVAIDNVPGNITVDFNADPALQALNEFVAAAESASQQAADSILNSLSGLEGEMTGLGLAAGAELGGSIGTGIKNGIADVLGSMGTGAAAGGWGANPSIGAIGTGDIGGYKNPATIAYEIGTWLRGLFRGSGGSGGGGGYAEGGYTGPGGKHEAAGIVHRGEYVIPKHHVNQSTGLPYADALGRLQRGAPGRRGYAGGGYVGGSSNSGHIASFGPMAAMQLAQALSTQIRLDSGAVAGAVSRSNQMATSVGAA